MNSPKDDYLVRPDPLDPRLTERVKGIDQTGAPIETAVVVERALTIFLNAQEIVTAMTINDHPEYLAVGYLLNQNMLLPDDTVTGVDYDEELSVVVVRTKRKTNYEKKLKKRVQTSGCAQGTVFGDLMEALENVTLPAAELRTSWLYTLTHKINTTPSLYLEAGAIHGCVLAVEDRPIVYMEDVGRHNAVDKIAGWMFKNHVGSADKIFYTTGRLTSEMVIKTVRMGIPILISRSGFTAWGVELARKANLTLIGRARGKRFIALSGAGSHRVRSGPRLCRGRKRQAPPQGRGARRLSRNARDRLLLLSVWCLPAAWRGAWAAATRRGFASAARPSCNACSPASARNAIASSSMPTAIRRDFADTGLPVVADSVPDFAGPLAGILAGLDWAAANARDCGWLLSVPGDCPFLPKDLVARLHEARVAAGTPLACARSGEWRHPVVALWPVDAARGSAPRAPRRRLAQDRNLDRTARRRHRRLAGRTGRSVLQRQYAGGRGKSGGDCRAIS